MFETGTGEKITAHGYGNFDLKMSKYQGNIAAKYFKKPSNKLFSSSNKIKLCYTQKVINHHPVSKIKVNHIPASCLV